MIKVAGDEISWRRFQEGAEYDDIINDGPRFHPGGVLEYLAIKENGQGRVRYVPLP